MIQIGRVREKNKVKEIVEKWGQAHIIFIQGDGGIGKTHFLKEMYNWYIEKDHQLLDTNQKIHPVEIIDFDDMISMNPDYLSCKIAIKIDPEIFKPYLQMQIDYYKMRKARVSGERLREERKKINQVFVNCLNSVTITRRIIFFIDSTDHIEPDKNMWQNFQKLLPILTNTVFIFAGRNAGNLLESLQNQKMTNIPVETINLKPFSLEDSNTLMNYLQKQECNIINIEANISEKLIILAEGRPILIALSVAWRACGISLDWIEKESIDQIKLLQRDEKHQNEFENKMIDHLRELDVKIYDLILLMGYIYPLNIKMIGELLIGENATDLFNKVKTYSFVKQLPNSYISLHDEVRRMINNHLWTKDDPGKQRRNSFSKRILKYYAEEINSYIVEIEKLKERLQAIEKNGEHYEKSLEPSLDIQKIEQYISQFKQLQLRHSFSINFDQGFKMFNELCKEAKNASSRYVFRETFFTELHQYENLFSPEQTYILYIRKANFYFDNAYYDKTEQLCEKIIERKNLSPINRIETLIQLANSRIRLGKINEGIRDFQQAIKIATANEFISKLIAKSKKFPKSDVTKTFRIPTLNRFWYKFISEIINHPYKTFCLIPQIDWKVSNTTSFRELAFYRIKILNGLGWSHRLIGNIQLAKKYYQEAMHKCLLEGGIKREELREDYCWILNNLAFVLSEHKVYRETAMINARQALKHWRNIGNDVGLGAGYLVLGNTYYRDNRFNSAMEAYQKAFDIFEPMRHKDWLGRIYSWRGILYLHMYQRDETKNEFLNKAEEELKESLQIGSLDIKAMTLNRLGRVYMAQKNWDAAEEKFKKSIDHAIKIPDYRYRLSSLARLIFVAAEKGENEVEKYYKMLHGCPKNIKDLYKYDVGLAYLGLVKLALRQTKYNPVIVNYLKKGIQLVIEYGFYGHGDITYRLESIEKDFNKIKPQIIWSIAQGLQDDINTKAMKNEAYYTVIPIIHKWTNWQKESQYE